MSSLAHRKMDSTNELDAVQRQQQCAKRNWYRAFLCSRCGNMLQCSAAASIMLHAHHLCGEKCLFDNLCGSMKIGAAHIAHNAEEGNAFFRSRSVCSVEEAVVPFECIHSPHTHPAAYRPHGVMKWHPLNCKITSYHILDSGEFGFFPLRFYASHAVLFRSRPSGV